MADSKDYLTVYKRFFDNFAKTVDPDDQLPVRVAGYRLWDNEIVGETVDWTLQYLSQRNCPPSLLAPITRIVIDEIKQAVETQPLALGFKSQENCYLPLKMMQAVTNKVNEVCLRFTDNGRVTSLPPPLQGPLLSSCAVKNSRRCMEDRHVILEDFHAFFNIKDASPASYYAVFDGHAGTDAAIYSVSHLHQFLAESPFYPTDPEKAIKDAFFRTDQLFIEKSNKEKLHSGTTAVCALLRQKEKKLYVAWLGDSQAILVRNGQLVKLVDPHKPERPDEKNRIESMGGSVLYWGTWRVNGQLAVSRAIGDILYKPYVTAEPDVRTVDLLGNEDFLVLACDGLWDFVSAEDVVRAVYNQVLQNPGDLEAVSQKLVQLSKQQGSTDNISVIVAFLTDPCQLAARVREETLPRAWAPANGPQPSAPAMDAFDIDVDLSSAAFAPAPPAPPAQTGDPAPAPAAAPAPAVPTNPFEAELATQKAAAAATVNAAGAGLLLDDPFQAPPFNNGHTNGNLFDFMDIARNGKSPRGPAHLQEEEDDDEDDEDSGPEAEDGADAKHASLLAKNPFGEDLDLDLELQRQQTSEFDPENEPRHETPTPPADEVPAGLGLVSDNVAESGEESEDEWNYYRVDPKEKPQECAEKEQQTKPEVCKDQSQEGEESAENMESQLNPNAAEFIPSPTHNMPSMEEILTKALATGDSSFKDTFSSVNTTDLLVSQEKEFDKQELSASQQEFTNPLNVDSNVKIEDLEKELSSGLNESAALSTKAEFGDESISSGVDFQKVLDTSSNIMETSLVGQDFLALEEQKSGNVIEDITEPSVVEKDSVFEQDLISDFQKEPVHISFELQKEIAPQMESEPERVKVDSDDQSPTLDSEPELHNVNSVTETKIVDNLEFPHNEVPVNNVPLLEDFMPVLNSASQDVKDLGNLEDGFAMNLEEKIGAADLLRDDVDFLAGMESKQLSTDNILEFTQTVEKTEFTESADAPAVLIQKDIQEFEGLVEVPSQLSESSLSELTDELPVQQETIKQLSNEISTPEYEKLEKDLEASEQYEEKLGSAKENIPVDFSSVNEINISSTSDVLLESAHPDKVALLDDACTESVQSEIISVENVTECSNGPLTAPVSDLLDPVVTGNDPQNVPQDSDILDHLIQTDVPQMVENISGIDILPATSLETAPLDSAGSQNYSLGIETRETASPDNSFIEQSGIIQDERSPVHIPTNEVFFQQQESALSELLEPTQAPPPTPLITELAEKEHLSFGEGNENFTEVVEKLSVTRQSDSHDIEEVKNITSETSSEEKTILSQEIVQDSETPATPPALINVSEPERKAPESVNDTKPVDNDVPSENAAPTIATVAAVGVVAAAAAVATTVTAAAPASDNKDSKKEKDVPAKKPAAVSVKDKKPSTEKPKTATKTAVSSRLSATATKPKSPTSPVKAPVAQKTAPTKPPTAATATSKPLSKPPITKTTARPLSSTAPRPATSITSKPKPAASQVPLKSTVPAVGLAKTRPISSSLEKKTVTNGDIKTSKRPEQLSTKTSTTTTRMTRPATAPATRTVSKTVSSVSSTIAKTKSSLNGPSKPRTSPSVPPVRGVTKVSNEKEIKETANKQISTRTTTSSVRSTTTTTASKTSVTSASRKIESKVVTNGKGPAMKPSGMLKTTTTTMSSRVSPKKPATTTRVKATKTESIVEKSETVQGSKTVIAMNE